MSVLSRVLVRGTNWLGDAVMTLPALRAVRARYPEAHITVMARPWVAGVYRREPGVDEVIAAPETWMSRVRRLRFDAAILFTNSFDSALTAWLGGVPRRIGYDRDGRRLLLTDPIPCPKAGEIPRHERFFYLELLRRAGIIDRLPDDEPILIHAAAQSRCSGLRLLANMGFEVPAVGVSPGAQNSRAKQWPPERFVEAALLVAKAIQGGIVLFGSVRERPLCHVMAAAIRKTGVPVLSLAGETTLDQFLDLAAACRVFLTNDSGAMHAASALAVPTVAIFGPTDYIATAPAGPVSRLVREPVECSPCMLRDCPIDHRCMTAVSPERVAETALDLLK